MSPKTHQKNRKKMFTKMTPQTMPMGSKSDPKSTPKFTGSVTVSFRKQHWRLRVVLICEPGRPPKPPPVASRSDHENERKSAVKKKGKVGPWATRIVVLPQQNSLPPKSLSKKISFLAPLFWDAKEGFTSTELTATKKISGEKVWKSGPKGTPKGTRKEMPK